MSIRLKRQAWEGSMNDSKALLPLVQAFFQEYLAGQRGLSRNTILAYRDAVKLFLSFLATSMGKQTARLKLDDLQAENVLAFLDDIEQKRHNRTATRNLRLAALRTFFQYLIREDTIRSGQYQKILAIPPKRTPRPVMGYLEVAEVQVILNSIDRSNPSGRRDYGLFSFLYNTGARVQEAVDVKVGAIRFSSPPIATLTGKGSKTRIVPLWQTTATILLAYLRERGVDKQSGARLFVNARGEPLTRFGVHHILRTRLVAAGSHCASIAAKRVSPHTFRHSTAMHLLQSGVDLTVIQRWLGHVQLATTHNYVEIDLEMKRKALAACNAPDEAAAGLQTVIDAHQDVIRWLDSL
jgi:integrase/recombinase XerD